MRKLDTKKTYAWMAEVPSGALSIHTDASFQTPKKDATAPVMHGVGWTVDVDGHLVGFGTSAFLDSIHKSSSVVELRAMLFSLDTLKSWHPDVLKDRHISIYCDNLSMIQVLQQASGQEECELTDQWLRRKIKSYGKDFLRISDYIAEFDLSFHWVKGHADNLFNNVSDALAQRSFKASQRAVLWSHQERNHWIRKTIASMVPEVKDLLALPAAMPAVDMQEPTISIIPRPAIPSHIRPQAPSRDFAIRQQIETNGFADGIPMIWIGTYGRFIEGKRVSALAYAGADKTINGSRVIVTNDTRAGKSYLELRALRFALKDYVKTEPQNKEKSLVVRLPSPAVVSHLSKMLIGMEPQVPAYDHRTKHELKLLKPMLDEVKIFPFPTKAIKPTTRGKQIAAKVELPQRRAVRQSAKDVLIELFPDLDFSQNSVAI